MAIASYIIGLLMIGSGPAEPRPLPVSCAYSDSIHREIALHEDCASVDSNGRAHMKPEYRRRLAFDRHGLASVRLGSRWFWFDRSGRSAETMLYDTWAEDFSNGLARSPRAGKIGFIDRSLRLVIPARYDGALPFDGGVAEVCMGCSLVYHGEHGIYEGGTWFCVDRRGRERRRTGRNC
jgi:hypothetical protein